MKLFIILFINYSETFMVNHFIHLITITFHCFLNLHLYAYINEIFFGIVILVTLALKIFCTNLQCATLTLCHSLIFSCIRFESHSFLQKFLLLSRFSPGLETRWPWARGIQHLEGGGAFHFHQRSSLVTNSLFLALN